MHEPLAQLLERTYSAAEREVIYRLIRGGGQVRHFAADPIPMETLQRILDAALDAPFVGGMPPWHLILVTSPALRARITAAVGERPRARRLAASGRPWSGAVQRSHPRAPGGSPLHLAVTYDAAVAVPWGSSEPWIPPWTSSAPAGHCRTCGWRRVPKGSGWSGSGLQTRARSPGCWRYPPGCSSSPTSASACPKNSISGPDEARGTGVPRGRRESRVYTNLWGQTDGSLVAFMSPADDPDSPALVESTSGREHVMREGRMSLHEVLR